MTQYTIDTLIQKITDKQASIDSNDEAIKSFQNKKQRLESEAFKLYKKSKTEGLEDSIKSQLIEAMDKKNSESEKVETDIKALKEKRAKFVAEHVEIEALIESEYTKQTLRDAKKNLRIKSNEDLTAASEIFGNYCKANNLNSLQDIEIHFSNLQSQRFTQ